MDRLSGCGWWCPPVLGDSSKRKTFSDKKIIDERKCLIPNSPLLSICPQVYKRVVNIGFCIFIVLCWCLAWSVFRCSTAMDYIWNRYWVYWVCLTKPFRRCHVLIQSVQRGGLEGGLGIWSESSFVCTSTPKQWGEPALLTQHSEVVRAFCDPRAPNWAS